MGYEASASASQSPYAPSIQPSATDPSPRRPSGVFRLFKRRYDDTHTSSSAESITSSSTRPQTPGADSVIGSLADSESGRGGKIPKNKKSGTFWGRRKSSLNFMTGVEESSSGGPAVQQRNGDNGAAVTSMKQQQQPRAVSSNVGENAATFAGGEEEEFPPRVKQKKSLTFWRRTSSLGLDRMGSGSGSGYGPENHQSTRNASIDVQNAAATNGQTSLLGEDTVMSEADAIASRPRSPPPVLPDVGVVVHEKGGLMGGEDWFGDIR